MDETTKILDVDENTDRRDEIDTEISSQRTKYNIQIQVSNAGIACEKLLENEGYYENRTLYFNELSFIFQKIARKGLR